MEKLVNSAKILKLMKEVKRYIIIFLIACNIIVFTILSKPFLMNFKNTDTIFNRSGCVLYDFNRLDVKLSGNLEWDKLQLHSNGLIIFENRKKVHRMPQNHGLSNLKIVYDGVELSNIQFFKVNAWESNDYYINLYRDSKKFQITHRIDGKSRVNKYHRKVWYYNEDGCIKNTEESSQNSLFENFD